MISPRCFWLISFVFVNITLTPCWSFSAASVSNKLNIPLISKVDHDEASDHAMLAQELALCHDTFGGIVDPHLHTAPWFDSAPGLIQELEASNVSIGLLYNPYPKMALPYDINTYTSEIAANSKGKVYALASLNTTHDRWEDHREFELNRLKEGLARDAVLGTKLAPPNTMLPLTGPIMDDVLAVTNESRQKLLAIHIGTTPFCGALGRQFGIECNCQEECVNPNLLIPQIEKYPNVRFALLHAGHEFLSPESDPEFYYNFQFTDACIKLAQQYDNVYLSLSAIFAQELDGTLRYPGGFETCRKMKQAGITHKVFWGSDASWNQGAIRPVLITAIKAMIQGGWTSKERAWALSGCARHVFGIPQQPSTTFQTRIPL